MVFGADNKEGKTFYGNTLREAQEKAKASEAVFINESFTPANESVKPVKPAKPAKLTEKEVYDWTAKEQKEWLKEHGITPGRYEDDRVKQILKTQ